jgi:hypothetical protein
MTASRKPTKAECVAAFVRCWGMANHIRDSLPAREAAERSYGVRSGRFTVDEMTARIEARRAEARAKAAS